MRPLAYVPPALSAVTGQNRSAPPSGQAERPRRGVHPRGSASPGLRCSRNTSTHRIRSHSVNFRGRFPAAAPARCLLAPSTRRAAVRGIISCLVPGPAVDPRILAICDRITAKCAKTVIDHILQHGFVTTEELRTKYGYHHRTPGIAPQVCLVRSCVSCLVRPVACSRFD